MISSDLLYTIGLVLVILYMLMGVDDFVWDLMAIARRSRNKSQKLDLQKLDNTPPKLLAVVIAAWHEDNVLGDVIDNVISSVHYPKSMYHIFLGVYPNDAPTIAVANALSEKYPNVHLIINCLPGPTSKAQNINYVITRIKAFEQERGWRFTSLTVHDSEDVVHPYELKVTNYLIDSYPALQFPVFPVVRMPRFSNFFKNITTGTYADEFAENHFTTMVNRRNAGAFVPSAGTGFALSRATLDSFGDEDVLPRDSLTEDYRLSLTLYEKDIAMYYVLERVPRISNNNKLVWDFISTRSVFPNTFKTAVKQKTRWILGITMQSFKFKDIFQTKGLRLAGRYSLYKDLKAKIGNLLAMVGYPVLIYFFVSLFIPLTPIYPKYSLSWYLSLAVTVMMVERQFFRGVAIYNVYGMRSVFFSCLFPPLIPIRLVWGNIINLVATLKAYRQYIFGNQTPKKKERAKEEEALKAMEIAAALPEQPPILDKPPEKASASATTEQPATAAAPEGEKKKLAWDKTDHTFLDKKVLKRYHRNLGDVLLEKGFVTPKQLQDALEDMRKYEKKQTIGGYLLQKGIINEEHLLSALSQVKHIPFIDVLQLEHYQLPQYAAGFDEALLRSLLTLPLLKMESGYLMMFCDDSPQDAQTTVRSTYNVKVNAVFASRETILNGLDIMFGHRVVDEAPQLIVSRLYDEGLVNYEQVVISSNYLISSNKPEQALLDYMGLLPYVEAKCTNEYDEADAEEKAFAAVAT